jgi:uncharacterized damage-inducible protein DinB
LLKIEQQLEAAERDAQALTEGLTEEQGQWRARPDSWSVAECLDHLAATNRVYLAAMQQGAARGRKNGQMHHRAPRPGFIGGWFARFLEPPVKVRIKASRSIRPRAAPRLADASASFRAAQNDVRAFLKAQADLDLAGIRFPNPFLPGVRFSLATGLHVITAHERRHLWQAWRVRNAAHSALGLPACNL